MHCWLAEQPGCIIEVCDMPSLNETMRELRLLYTRVSLLQKERDQETSPGDPKGHKALLDRQIQEWEALIATALETLVRFPPYHSRHFAILDSFYEKGATYDDAVFLMTKFPKEHNPSPQDVRLTEIITHVMNRLETNGYHPRIASEKRQPYHNWLWDNVEAYLFCCGSGVAIVEDKYQAEFNPNVAMEWGWMRATGKKPVLYLIEKDFKHLRADTQGMLFEEFSWDDPKPGIDAALDKYFPKK
jgi:hypothetical protein